MAERPPAAADRAQPLPIAAALRDRDCAGAVSVVVSNLPPGAALSAGADNGDGSWTLTAADLDGLTVTPPADRFGGVTVTVSAVAPDPENPKTPPTTTAFGLAVDFGPPPQPPVVAAAAEERTVALDIDIGLSEDDAPGPISIAIGGVPAGATLSAGSDSGDGTWVLDATALPGLSLSLPAGAPDQITLGIAATAADGTSAAGVLSLVVSELPDAPPPPEPVAEAAAAAEPKPEPETEPEPEPELEPEPMPEGEAVFTADFVPDFVTEELESDDAPAPTPPPAKAAAATASGGRAPVAYWKLDELLPGTVSDEMANHHGRSFGIAANASGGAFDTVDSFDGIDDYIAVPHAPDLSPAAGTLTVWFNAFAGGQGAIAAKGAPTADARLALTLVGRRLRFALGDGETTHAVQGGAFHTAEWNQATVTWGAAGMALYLNGAPVAADDYAGGIAGNDAPWLFGAAAENGGDGGAAAVGDLFHGELDDIALFAEQFDADAARRLFQLGVNGMMSDAAAGETLDAGGDSALDLDAIPAEADGPASLAVLDTETDADADADDSAGDATDDAPAEAAVETADDAAGDAPAGGDSGLDLDAIPAEADGPASLATLDVEPDAEVEDADVAEVAAAAPPAAADADGVLVFGAGGDYVQGGDGWSDAVETPPDDDAPAVSIAADGELTLAGGDKLEW